MSRALPDRYTCEEVFRRMDDYLDRELAPEETALVKEHLDTCALCATEYGFETRVLDDLRQKLRRIDVPPDLLDKVVRKLREAKDTAPET
jgi:anti-sigma factor (TIGR02949 family)